ncbi:MAG: hypothetical protein ACLRPT_05980 [Akkermansia muciniphila]
MDDQNISDVAQQLVLPRKSAMVIMISDFWAKQQAALGQINFKHDSSPSASRDPWNCICRMPDASS